MQRMTDVTATVHAGEPAWTVGRTDLGRRAAHEAVLRAPDGDQAGGSGSLIPAMASTGSWETLPGLRVASW